jgi:hypothetical protein
MDAVVLVLVALVTVVLLAVIVRPDHSSTRLGRAADKISEGFENADKELHPEKKDLGDKIKDAFDK